LKLIYICVICVFIGICIYIYIYRDIYIYVYMWLTLPSHDANRYGESDSNLLLELVLVTCLSAAWISSPSGCAVPRPNIECVQKPLSENENSMQCPGTLPRNRILYKDSWLTPHAGPLQCMVSWLAPRAAHVF
jgi:hypothetical protein